MKKFSANYVFPGNSAPIKKGVIVLDDEGIVKSLVDPTIDNVNWAEVEIHEGIICPGFVNTHCHLELSHLKGKVAEKTQLHGFVKDIISVRENFTTEERQIAIQLAEQEMIQNGIVAVGDICNGNTSFLQKAKKNLQYYTFLEVFGLNPDDAIGIIARAKKLENEYHNGNRISITPHAPYSMSTNLMSLANQNSQSILTIHNQETESENELFLRKSGLLYNQLRSISEHIKDWKPTGKNSVQSYLPQFPLDKKILLVHNTFTDQVDVDFAKNHSSSIYWCFCPNANEYIEEKQPDYSLFLTEKCTIGTDSLASNWSLSILDELKTISKKNPSINLEKLIKWATFNGAEFLEFKGLGSIEKGKKPGLNLIKNVDLEHLLLTKNSETIVLA
ncbi:MAG: hypothetical protein COA97_03095 [Flavobacteriales bacterium]|nr:MAG: hypothetical protein COA97_03095 [Flavobacteriales bacterium]